MLTTYLVFEIRDFEAGICRIEDFYQRRIANVDFHVF